MKAFVMDNAEKQWDLDTEEEVIERYEEVLDKLRERLRKKREEEETATLYMDRGQLWVHFSGSGIRPLTELEGDLS